MLSYMYFNTHLSKNSPRPGPLSSNHLNTEGIMERGHAPLVSQHEAIGTHELHELPKVRGSDGLHERATAPFSQITRIILERSTLPHNNRFIHPVAGADINNGSIIMQHCPLECLSLHELTGNFKTYRSDPILAASTLCQQLAGACLRIQSNTAKRCCLCIK